MQVLTSDLVHKGLVQEVRPSDTEVKDVDLLENSVVEGIQEPRRVRHLHTHNADTCHTHKPGIPHLLQAFMFLNPASCPT